MSSEGTCIVVHYRDLPSRGQALVPRGCHRYRKSVRFRRRRPVSHRRLLRVAGGLYDVYHPRGVPQMCLRQLAAVGIPRPPSSNCSLPTSSSPASLLTEVEVLVCHSRLLEDLLSCLSRTGLRQRRHLADVLVRIVLTDFADVDRGVILRCHISSIGNVNRWSSAKVPLHCRWTENTEKVVLLPACMRIRSPCSSAASKIGSY